MTNGQQRGEDNLVTFLSWIASKTDFEFREMTVRGQLSRQEISRECGFTRSVFAQNPRIKDALKTLEDELRARDVLPVLAESSEPDGSPPVPQLDGRERLDQQRLKRLESENASLRAELTKLRTDLEHYRRLDAILAETGRFPR